MSSVTQSVLRYRQTGYSRQVTRGGSRISEATYTLLIPGGIAVFDAPTHVHIRGVTLSGDMIGDGDYEITIKRIDSIQADPPP